MSPILALGLYAMVTLIFFQLKTIAATLADIRRDLHHIAKTPPTIKELQK